MWGVPNPRVDDLLSLLGCFEVSPRVAHYSVEFDRVWGVPNPGVDDLPDVLRHCTRYSDVLLGVPNPGVVDLPSLLDVLRKAHSTLQC